MIKTSHTENQNKLQLNFYLFHIWKSHQINFTLTSKREPIRSFILLHSYACLVPIFPSSELQTSHLLIWQRHFASSKNECLHMNVCMCSCFSDYEQNARLICTLCLQSQLHPISCGSENCSLFWIPSLWQESIFLNSCLLCNQFLIICMVSTNFPSLLWLIINLVFLCIFSIRIPRNISSFGYRSMNPPKHFSRI